MRREWKGGRRLRRLRRTYFAAHGFAAFRPLSALSYSTSAGMLGASLSFVHGSSRPGMNGRASVGRWRAAVGS